MALHPKDLDPVEVPSASNCPYCGGEPTDASARDHHLSTLAYLHDDVKLKCADCRRAWTCGVPIGGPPKEAFEDLWCPSCNGGYMLVHRVDVSGVGVNDDGENEGNVGIHLKCPHHERFKCPACDQLQEPRFNKDGEPYCPRCTAVMDTEALDGNGCFHFKVTTRPVEGENIAPMHYPMITGDTERAYKYGAHKNQ